MPNCDVQLAKMLPDEEGTLLDLSELVNVLHGAEDDLGLWEEFENHLLQLDLVVESWLEAFDASIPSNPSMTPTISKRAMAIPSGMESSASRNSSRWVRIGNCQLSSWEMNLNVTILTVVLVYGKSPVSW